MSHSTEEDIRRLVTAFYGRLREDPDLGPIFVDRLGDHWEAHIERMCDFWTSVLLASGRYRGNPAEVHARIKGLAANHYDRWLVLFEETAHKVLEPHQAADVVARSHRMRIPLERAPTLQPIATTP